MQQDPKGFAARDPNLYRYVGNNTTNFTDPSGLDRLEQVEMANGKIKLFGNELDEVV
jgi:hypothetical protein